MKSLRVLSCAVLWTAWLLNLSAQGVGVDLEKLNGAAAAVRSEVERAEAMRAAMSRADDQAVDAALAAAADVQLALPQSVALARRAAMACGWLRNDNEYGQAMKLARKAIAQLARLRESTDQDRTERLYWEAWLEGEVLDRKVRAIKLLDEAVRLAPEDERILRLHERLLGAVAQFGR